MLHIYTCSVQSQLLSNNGWDVGTNRRMALHFGGHFIWCCYYRLDTHLAENVWWGTTFSWWSIIPVKAYQNFLVHGYMALRKRVTRLGILLLLLINVNVNIFYNIRVPQGQALLESIEYLKRFLDFHLKVILSIITASVLINNYSLLT